MPNKNQRLLQTSQLGYYVPHKMWVALVLFSALVFYMRADLAERFMSHPSLNGLIVLTMGIVIFMAFNNIYKIQRAASFLKRVQAFEAQPDEQTQQELMAALPGQGSYINTYHFQRHLAGFDAEQNRFVEFDDTASRLIKSKIGLRASHMRSSVQYLAGVLVMLGLIGTFWGLLSTITAVGEAMGSLTGGIDNGGMEKFLAAISKPLQGMGVAFSASLFGLSGSLLGGLLNSFCSKGMDKFIEDFGIWIDTRIPAKESKKAAQQDPVKLLQEHNNQVVTAIDGALTKIGQQSQEMFVQFAGVLTELTSFTQQQQQAIQTIGNESRINGRLADSMEQAVLGLKHESTSLREALVTIPDIQKGLGQDLRQMSNAVTSSQDRIANHVEQQALATSKTQTSLNELVAGYTAMVGLLGKMVTHAAAAELEQSPAIELMQSLQQQLQEQLETVRFAGLPNGFNGSSAFAMDTPPTTIPPEVAEA